MKSTLFVFIALAYLAVASAQSITPTSSIPLELVVTAHDFDLFPSDKSYSMVGAFDYVNLKESQIPRKPIVEQYDHVTRSLVVNHTTTYHLIRGDLGLSAICLVIGAWRCYRTLGFTSTESWNELYRGNVTTDNDLHFLVNKNLFPTKLYKGLVKDHHVTLRNKVAAHVHQIALGPYAGIPIVHHFGLPFSCAIQAFDWDFRASNVRLGRPHSSVFDIPSFMGPIENLPIYDNFAANWPCTQTQPV